MAKYKVTKIKVDKEGSDRYVKAGNVAVGEVYLVVGQSMVVGNELTTSAVERIEPANGENLLVKTRNSTYSLEKLSE